MAYIRETTAKRLVRLYQYETAYLHQREHVRRRWEAVVLAGPDAGEVGCLKHILHFDSLDVTFVDNAYRNGLKAAKKKWPLTKTYFGDVRNVLRDGGRNLSFVNLDLTGYPNEQRLRYVTLAGNRLAPDGIVFYTFYRTREVPGTEYRKKLDGASGKTLKEKRNNLVISSVKKALGKEFELIFSMDYVSVNEHCTSSKGFMGVVGFQYRPNTTHKEWRREETKTLVTNLTMQEVKLRIEALRLRKTFNAHQVGEILNINPGTVAAWLANKTRGNYKKG